MSLKRNVLFANPKDIIDWVKNPIKYSEITNWMCKNQHIDLETPCDNE